MASKKTPISRKSRAAPRRHARRPRRYDARPDRADERDWYYKPTLAALPDQVVSIDRVPVVLNQGKDGACTGFALAAVINLLLRQRNIERLVSPYMLYAMARRHDEYPGERYAGSSARGAIKGWANHGVCDWEHWPAEPKSSTKPERQIAANAQLTPAGAYFRLMHKRINHLQSALFEVGALYMTLMIHDGWDDLEPECMAAMPLETIPLTYAESGSSRRLALPVIRRKGKADRGHAVAIVGYAECGFIIQDSSGRRWGGNGFALLPYDDHLDHAVDVWAVQLGVPIALGIDQVRSAIRAAKASPAPARPFALETADNSAPARVAAAAGKKKRKDSQARG